MALELNEDGTIEKGSEEERKSGRVIGIVNDEEKGVRIQGAGVRFP